MLLADFLRDRRGQLRIMRTVHRERSPRSAPARLGGGETGSAHCTASNLVGEEKPVLRVERPFARGAAAPHLLGQRVEIVRGRLVHGFMAGTRNRVQFDLAMPVLAFA